MAKGSQFDVHTTAGIVSVLGTQFKVKDRDNLFEVICYEGSVRVSYQSEETILKPGDSFLLLNGKIIAREKEKALTPSWLNNESYFGSIPLGYVLNELERQYDVSIDASGINKSQLFTGSFVHSDLNMALKSITLAFNLNYSVDNDTVRIERE